LESLHAWLKEVKLDISGKDFMIHVLNGLPVEYKIQVSKLEEQFGSTPLTIQDMHTELSLKYTQLKCQAAEKSETDQVLVVFHKFKGKCMNCGKFGHKSNECHSKTRNSKGEGTESKKTKSKKGTNKSTIKCFSCREMGHYKLKCPKNKSKNPTGKQSEKEVDNILIMIDERDTPCNDIWIANLGALMHIINSEKGLYDMKNICEPVKSGNGKLVYATKVGRLKVLYVDEE